jgi:hypothetical protein
VVVCDDAPFRARGGKLAAALPGDARSFAQGASAHPSVEVHRSLASTTLAFDRPGCGEWAAL